MFYNSELFSGDLHNSRKGALIEQRITYFIVVSLYVVLVNRWGHM